MGILIKLPKGNKDNEIRNSKRDPGRKRLKESRMKSFQQFISETYGKFIPIDASKHSLAAIENILYARRKAENVARQNANAANATSFHKSWTKEQKIRAIMAGNPGMSREEAASKASLRIGRQKKVKVDEAVSTNDPNRGKPGRKKPLVPQGMMPDDTINPKTGVRVGTFGKLHDRMTNLSPATRDRYRKNYGYRTRVAGRGRRLYPMTEEETKKDKYEGQESTSSMIARLVARRQRKLGMKVSPDVERDIDPKYKNEHD